MPDYQKVDAGQVLAADGDDQVRGCGLDVQPRVAELDGLAENFEAEIKGSYPSQKLDLRHHPVDLCNEKPFLFFMKQSLCTENHTSCPLIIVVLRSSFN